MKKMFAWVLVFAMAAMITACGTQNAVQPDAAQDMGAATPSPSAEPNVEPTPDAQQPESTPDTSENIGREQNKDLVYMLEGMEETEPATLFVGDGYSIYIPDNTFRYEKDTENGVPTDTWESIVNEDVEFEILDLGEMDLKQAQEWVMREEDDYQLIEDKRGGLGGTDRESDVLDVRFETAGNRIYALMSKYPMEATEGFGTRLQVVADTFEITQ